MKGDWNFYYWIITEKKTLSQLYLLNNLLDLFAKKYFRENVLTYSGKVNILLLSDIYSECN